MKNKKRINLLFDLSVIFLVVLSFIYNDLEAISIICVLSLIFILLGLFCRRFSFFSFTVIFLVLLFVFHCGYSILWLIDYDFSRDYALTLPLLSDDIWCETLKYSLYFIDILYFIVKKRVSNNSKNSGSLSARKNIKVIGLIFTVVFFIPRIFIDLLFIIVGYEDAFNVTISGMIEVFAEGFFVGIMLLLIAYRNEDKKRKIVLFLGLLICAIGMLSGRRQEKVVYLLGILIVYFNGINTVRHSIKKKVALFVIFYFFIVLIATIGDLRAKPQLSPDLFLRCFMDNMKLKVIFEQIEEFAYASFSLGAIVKTYSAYGTGFGWNYFATFVELLPNVGGTFSSIIDRLSFVQYIPDELYYWLGGSILGEVYYNFGWYGLFFAIPLGYLIRNISNSIDVAFNRGKINYFTIICVILIGPMLLWIRGSFGYIVRPVVWLFMFAIMANCICFPKKTMI